MPEYLENLNLLGLVGAILFFAIASSLAMTAYQIGIGELKVGSRRGFTKKEIKETERTWDTGHRAARPFLFIAAVLALFHGIGCLGVALAMGQDSHQLVQILLVSGLVVTIALYLLAQQVALGAVRSSRR